MTEVHVAAEISFEVLGAGGASARGRLRGSAGRLTLEIDNPAIFAGGGDSQAIRRTAEALASRGIAVRVVHEGRLLVTLGAVSAPWWQRRLTGSRRIRLGSWRGAWTSLRAGAAAEPVLPDADSLPPPTLFPIAPTFARRIRRPSGTTHDPAQGGGPRLVARSPETWTGSRQAVFWLTKETTTIGSDPSCDVVLDGLAAHHATVVHDGDDEYVISSTDAGAAAGPDAQTRVHGAVVREQLLRTGARVDIGRHCFAYFREEYADHGRPYGGRVGGEAGHQRPQPPRPASRG